MDLFQHISSQSTILTPNRRLTASISKKYAHWQMTKEKKCWPTLDILPLYPSWLERLWKGFSSQYFDYTFFLLSVKQEQILWEKILRDAPENEALLQISETAKLAKSAWETLKRWQVDLKDSSLKLTDDSRAFLGWAQQFQTLCKEKNWLDINSLADVLAQQIRKKKIIPPKHMILTGFTEIAPQYQYLLEECKNVGSHIEHYPIQNNNLTTHAIGLMDTETEIQTMARWAKTQLSEANLVGCIVPNLETQRETVSRIFSEIIEEDQFNISAGKNLTSFPVIFDALLFLSLNTKNIPINTIGQLIKSPFLGNAERERYKRILYDNRLHSHNVTTVVLQDLINQDYKHNLLTTCPLLAAQIQHFIMTLKNVPKKCLISEWITLFSELLKQLGWPGERSLNSHEYQVVQNSWLPLLDEYASFNNILGPQTYQSALHYLNCLAKNTVFQPESPEAPIQILGLLEAAEIPFDSSWVMGLDDTVWPARPKPNPFIPLRLQKELCMPNASAERELIYCQQLTLQLQSSAKHVIFSYPEQREDAELRPSSILRDFPHLTINQLNLSPFQFLAEQIFQTKQLDYFEDFMAPVISETEKIHGGVRIFKSQADCPFKAFTEIRLHAKKIEESSIGLRKLDRGNMIHRALELIWRELGCSEVLLRYSDSDLDNLIHRHAETALKEAMLQNGYSHSKYLSLELERLKVLIQQWLQLEKERPSFKVTALEQEISVTIGPVNANFRIDRIDELTSENGQANQLIIDYKTGKEIDKSAWFGQRLDEPQLPIYCIANPEAILGIAFAKVNPNHIEMAGISKNPLQIKTLLPLADVKFADASLWDEQIKIWHAHLTKLGEDFYQGHAQVSPKDVNQTCRLCGLQALCRIHENSFIDEDNEHDFS